MFTFFFTLLVRASLEIYVKIELLILHYRAPYHRFISFHPFCAQCATDKKKHFFHSQFEHFSISPPRLGSTRQNCSTCCCSCCCCCYVWHFFESVEIKNTSRHGTLDGRREKRDQHFSRFFLFFCCCFSTLLLHSARTAPRLPPDPVQTIFTLSSLRFSCARRN